ncbi:hypothetical protein Celaphus_00014265 [Cervus elaphus hippelaphus]|uniref:Uncharacterized protein n=1 Tax=Cervus elaphus hippelaphus TaxID=46360 RepID=A0A212D4D5_CEREH|nr:hypothetical protein Celaphus_00014265 [Cervus elaphus hippelaphus]
MESHTTLSLIALGEIIRTTINLLLQLSKLASNVSCVKIQHRCISSTDLAWMVQNNPLSCEASSFHGWITFAVTSHIATTDIFDRHVLDIEAHIVPRKGFTQCFVVHFCRLHSSCYIDWSKGDHHARSENTSLHTTHRDSTNATNFIDILERQMQGFVSWGSLCIMFSTLFSVALQMVHLDTVESSGQERASPHHPLHKLPIFTLVEVKDVSCWMVRLKQLLAKKHKRNHSISPWIGMKTDSKLKYNSKGDTGEEPRTIQLQTNYDICQLLVQSSRVSNKGWNLFREASSLQEDDRHGFWLKLAR